jgi:hypothetical protein
METPSKEYQALRRDSQDDWHQMPLDVPQWRHSLGSQIRRWATTTTAVAVLLVISLAANVFLVLQYGAGIATKRDGDTSFYGKHVQSLQMPSLLTTDIAKLERNVPIAIQPNTEYTEDNMTAVTALWQKLSGDPGVVALPEAFVKDKNLPHAMRFPWDEDKGVYLLAGFHNLHCLVCTHARNFSPPLGLPHVVGQAKITPIASG